MPKNNPLRKSRTAEDEDEQGHAADAYWMSEEDRETESADSDEEETERAEADEDQRAHSELYRAGKIDAYLHYLKMRPPVRESEPVTLRRSAPVVERPRYRSVEEDEERDVRLYGYQPRTIRRPSPRAPRLSSRQPRRNLARDIAVAASLSLAVGGVTGLIVYDRTSGGTFKEARVWALNRDLSKLRREPRP